MTKKVQLLFYKGCGTWLDRVIRWVTRSPYSHVELVIDEFWENGKPMAHCISSSPRDGGVRERVITLKPENWDSRYCLWISDDECVIDIIRHVIGAKYDFLGILLPRLFSLGYQSKSRWFCSEVVGYALGLDQPERMSPGDLYHRIAEANVAWRAGLGTQGLTK